MENKTSLEKSHSKWSNFKLTFLCVCICISVSTIWVVVCFKDYFRVTLSVLLGCFSIIILLLSVVLLCKFKR